MTTEMNSNLAPVELSEQELAEVAGGIDIFLSGSMFEQSDVSLAQQTGAGPAASSTNTVFKTSHTFSSAFQFIGLGFGSMSEVTDVFKGLDKLFGRRS